MPIKDARTRRYARAFLWGYRRWAENTIAFHDTLR